MGVLVVLLLVGLLLHIAGFPAAAKRLGVLLSNSLFGEVLAPRIEQTRVKHA